MYGLYTAERVENDHLLRNSTLCVEHNVDSESKGQPLNIITICNTGALATCSLGTALGRFNFNSENNIEFLRSNSMSLSTRST